MAICSRACHGGVVSSHLIYSHPQRNTHTHTHKRQEMMSEDF
uniref:Uncharacterized protein n=1 Tax=Arundo donax TaxID=35708 RepID=A0A0A9BCE4_ARUDO